MEALRQGEVKVPLGGDKVYKDQCVLSFDTPVSLLVFVNFFASRAHR